MKTTVLLTLTTVMGLTAGIAAAYPEHAVTVPEQNYQQGANAPSAHQDTDSRHDYRTLHSGYGK